MDWGPYLQPSSYKPWPDPTLRDSVCRPRHHRCDLPSPEHGRRQPVLGLRHHHFARGVRPAAEDSVPDAGDCNGCRCHRVAPEAVGGTEVQRIGVRNGIRSAETTDFERDLAISRRRAARRFPGSQRDPMNLRCILWVALGLACSCLPQPDAAGQDWPQWGGSDSKNMVAEELQVLPSDAANGRPVFDGDFLYVSTSNGVDRAPRSPINRTTKLPSRTRRT